MLYSKRLLQNSKRLLKITWGICGFMNVYYFMDGRDSDRDGGGVLDRHWLYDKMGRSPCDYDYDDYKKMLRIYYTYERMSFYIKIGMILATGPIYSYRIFVALLNAEKMNDIHYLYPIFQTNYKATRSYRMYPLGNTSWIPI